MYLKSLDIFGFKSFPDKTLLTFDPGITVVVGPNGCGKSNVFDAIKWALGEQSPKSLRGAKMEDVIFSGTQTHAPLNYAEVGLTFNNEDNYLPIDYKEVVVARRLFRSGESQYFINKTPTRLKDIEELFMGTGIGESSYSFIEQGKVEALLSYKPEDKRLIFDEASGIVKYKDKKKETMKKLKEADDNILRLDDIISEVKRQTRYLERQVAKAKKYKEISVELIEIEKKLANIKIKDFQVKINSILEEVTSLQEKKNIKDKDIIDKNKFLDDLNNKLKEVKQELDNINGKVISTTSYIDNDANHININKQRVEELKFRIDNLNKTIEETKTRIALQEARIIEEKKSIESIDSDIINAQTLLQQAEEIRIKKEDQTRDSKMKITSVKNSILHFEEKRIESSNALIELGAQIQNLFSRKKRLILDKTRIDNNLIERKESFDSLKGEVSSLKEQVDSLKGDKVSLNVQLKELDALLESYQSQVVEKEKVVVELASYLSFLQDLKMKYEEFPVSKNVTISFNEKPEKINKLIASLKNAEFREVNVDGNIVYQTQVEAKIISLPEEELTRRIDVLNEEVEQIKSLIAENKKSHQTLMEKIAQEEETILNMDSVLREKSLEETNLAEEMVRFEDELQIINTEYDECIDSINESESRKHSYETEVSALQDSLSSANQELDVNQEIVASCSDEIKKLEIDVSRTEAEIKGLGEHKESFYSKLSMLEEEKNNLLNRINSLDEEIKTSGLNVESLTEQVVNLEEKIIGDKQKIESLNKEKLDFETKISSLENEFYQSSKVVKDLEKDSEEISSHIYNRKLKIQTLDFEKAKIGDYLKQVYSVDFVVNEEQPIDVDMVALEENRDQIRKKLKSLGEVNLVAIDEFEELNTRFEFLNTQREDLLNAKDALKKAIQKINRTSKEVFLEVFNKIEEEFKKYFRFLFNGGRAQLILIDPDNVLESGVEIEVQPPGKKLQNVSLLSGGEKALTAVALIFSIFKVRPSPLCVLDEIDAPLDEANVDRFNMLLKEFSPIAQFIVITHNKRTMSRADVLYGVTMQEKGISKLVSVRFAEEKTPVT